MYARLARLAPAGLAELRSGDLLARLVGDVDGLADLWLRVLLPYTSLALVGTATVLLVGWLVPVAGVALAVGLLVTAVGAPAAASAVGRRAERALAPTRGRSPTGARPREGALRSPPRGGHRAIGPAGWMRAGPRPSDAGPRPHRRTGGRPRRRGGPRGSRRVGIVALPRAAWPGSRSRWSP